MSRSYTQSLIERSGCILCCSEFGGNETKDEKQETLIVSSNEAWSCCLDDIFRLIGGRDTEESESLF